MERAKKKGMWTMRWSGKKGACQRQMKEEWIQASGYEKWIAALEKVKEDNEREVEEEMKGEEEVKELGERATSVPDSIEQLLKEKQALKQQLEQRDKEKVELQRQVQEQSSKVREEGDKEKVALQTQLQELRLEKEQRDRKREQEKADMKRQLEEQLQKETADLKQQLEEVKQQLAEKSGGKKRTKADEDAIIVARLKMDSTGPLFWPFQFPRLDIHDEEAVQSPEDPPPHLGASHHDSPRIHTEGSSLSHFFTIHRQPQTITLFAQQYPCDSTQRLLSLLSPLFTLGVAHGLSVNFLPRGILSSPVSSP
jgi:DNA repair exonuclease SbcCD ATPase subunit